MIDRLVRFINTVSFHRGLALGALVGAAIAGSTLWTRITRHAAEGAVPDPARSSHDVTEAEGQPSDGR